MSTSALVVASGCFVLLSILTATVLLKKTCSRQSQKEKMKPFNGLPSSKLDAAQVPPQDALELQPPGGDQDELYDDIENTRFNTERYSASPRIDKSSVPNDSMYQIV